MYRVLPSVCHKPFQQYNGNPAFLESLTSSTPNQLRWDPFPIPSTPHDFIDGLRTVCSAGHPETRNGLAVHVYTATTSMHHRAMNNSDGDMLIVPQEGTIVLRTELGLLQVAPNEIAVVPRNVRFAVESDTPVRGYILEVYSGHFELPDLGPIGANGLANPQDFYYPVANIDTSDKSGVEWEIVNKYQNSLWTATQDHTPFDVVAWRGNYAPFKYDLARFCAINSVTHDHPDPSIFTVLTCKSTSPGTAIADFAIFPPRWACAEHTFRPPYFHRNCMSEFMGLIHGSYEAKQGGFLPGGASLHSIGTPHGPDVASFEGASKAKLEPVRVADGTMAFMFESSLMMKVSTWAMASGVQPDYWTAWSGFKANFQQKP